MSVYRRGQRALKSATPEQAKAIQEGLAGRPWTVEVQLGNFRYTLSSGTDEKEVAKGMEQMLKNLYARGSDDFLSLLREGGVSLREAYADYSSGAGLGKLVARVQAEAKAAAQPTLGTLVPKWHAWMKTKPVSKRSKRELAASTVARYKLSMEKLLHYVGVRTIQGPEGTQEVHDTVAIKAAWERLGPDIFTNELLDAYRDARKTDGRSASTVNRDLNTLLAFSTWLETNEKIVHSRPKVVREKEPKGRDRVLSPNEWLLVREAFMSLNGGVAQLRGRRSGGTKSDGFVPMPQLWVLFEVLVLTGLRVGEALALEWGDLDKTRGLIHISRSLEWSGKDSKSGQGEKARPVKAGRLKSLSSERDVPLSEELTERLDAHRKVFEHFGTGRRARIFPEQVFNLRRMQALWNRALVAADLNHARVHDLRHTFAAVALDNSTTINTLQAILGHCDAHMVMRYVRRQNSKDTTLAGTMVAATLLGPPKS